MSISVPRLDRLSPQERGITIADFLVPIRVSERIGVRARHIALILAGALMIALAARVQFDLPGTPVPVTGQTFAVLLAGGALGFRRGLAASAVYLAVGLVGVPVFAGGTHGPEIVLGVTGGYLIGFLLAAAIVGRLAELGWDRKLLGSVGAMIIGNAAIFAVGVPWLAITAEQPMEWAVANGLTPFLGGEVVKIGLAAAAFPAAWWVVGRRPGDR